MARGNMMRPSIGWPVRWMLAAWMAVGILCLLSGCAKYEYQILRPAEVAGHIGKSPVEVKLDPLVYKMQSYDNHLVVQVFNLTEEPVEIVGERSNIVTPDKRSIPIASQSIPSGAHVKLVLPPVRTDIQPTGPALHIGFGMQGDAAGVQKKTVDVASVSPVAQEQRVVYLVDLDDSDYWDWDGQTDVTLILTCRQGDKFFKQAFVFHRVKK